MNNNVKKNRRMPRECAIREYWADELNWMLKGFDSRSEFIESGVCFACGLFSSMSKGCERAHIRARTSHGMDDVANLHMLCRTCHKVSELKSGPRYWKWFYDRRGSDTINMLALQRGLSSEDAYLLSKIYGGYGH